MARSTARRVILTPTATTTPTSGSFLTLADNPNTGPVLLAEITLTARAGNPTRTVRLSDKEFIDGDGNPWNSLIFEKTTLDMGGNYLESGWQPADIDLVVGDGRLGFQGSNETISKLLSQYKWGGSDITVYQAFDELTTVADWQVIFQGEVMSVINQQPTEFTIACVQDRRWVVSVPPNKIEKNTYPNAPSDVIGIPRPILIGNHSAGRFLLLPPGGPNSRAYRAGITRAAIPTVVTNSGAGSDVPEYLISDKPIGGLSQVAYFLVPSLNRFAGSGFQTIFTNSEGGTSVKFDTTDLRKFELALLGTEDGVDNNAPTWNEAAREDKDITLSGPVELDHDAGTDTLDLILPDMSSLGEFVDADVWIWFAKNASATTHPRFGLKHSSGDVFADLPAAASATFPSDTPISSALVNVNVRITDWDNIILGRLRVETRLAGQKVQVHRIVLLVEFKPAARVVRRGVATTTGIIYNLRGQTVYRSGSPVSGHGEVRGSQVTFGRKSDITTPDILSYDTPLWTHQVGVDDVNHDSGAADGTYTGTPSLLIEHPSEVVHWALRELGTTTAAEITTASSTFGSFDDIRTSLANYKMLHLLSADQKIEEFISDVSSQFLIWFFRQTTLVNQPWAAIPWDVGSGIDYRSATAQFRFSPDNVFGVPKISSISNGRVRNVVHVNFDLDMRLNSYSQSVFISDTDSRGWDGSAFVRDQNSGAPENRESRATESIAAYGRKEHTLNLGMIRDEATATSVRNRYFDLLSEPKHIVRFTTFMNAVDLERGQVITFSTDWNSIMPCPVLDSGGDWFGKGFRVTRITRREANATTYNVEAVEV